jgi:Family of unknown function (DUF6308)
MHEGFVDRLQYLIRPDRFDDAVELAKRYWREPYTGRMFHELSDTSHPNEITAKDIVAVSTLGVTVPAGVAVWLPDEGAATVRALLQRIATDRDVWEPGDLLNAGGPTWGLWDLLATARWPAARPNNGMGTTTISKLLATKRPRLVPVWDSVVRKLFPPVDNYWAAFSHALADDNLRLQLSIASSGHAPEGASLLRRIDAPLWMVGQLADW